MANREPALIKRAPGWRRSALLVGLALGHCVRAVSAGEASDSVPAELLDRPLEDLLSMPIVESVSLRDQVLIDAPASVTVIREEQIRASGATNLAELLRLVPGMSVMQLTGNTYSIGLRGITRLSNDRVLILIDGHPYRDYVSGEARLGSIHISPMDVVKIEVIRGPGSVTYGAGALSGVVNILTKSPGPHGTVDASSWGAIGAVRDQGDASTMRLQNNGGARVVVNLKNDANTLGARVGVLTNHPPEWPNRGSTAGADPTSSFPDANGYSVFGSGRYWGNENLQMNAELFHTATEDIGISDISDVPVSQRTTTQQLSYRVERRQLFGWMDGSLSIRARRSTVESPPSTVQAVDSRAYGVNSLLKLTFSLLDKRNTTTAAYEASFAESRGYFCSPTTLSGGLILNNDTYLAGKKLLVSLAARQDTIVSNDNAVGRIVHRAFSYRGALTYHLADDHALRFSASSSFRTPTPYETFADVRSNTGMASATSGKPPIRFVVGNPLLVPERVLNFEVGYRAKMLGMVQADLAAYAQEVEDLIANDPTNGSPSFKINRFNYRQLAVEVGLRMYPSVTTSAYLNYSFVYSQDSDTGDRIKEFPTHIGGLGFEMRLPWRARVSMDTYYLLDYQPDVTMLNPSASLPVLTHEKRRAATQVLVNLRAGHRVYQDAVEVFLMGKNLLGLVRDPADLRMYPIESMQPIGATLLAGVLVNTN